MRATRWESIEVRTYVLRVPVRNFVPKALTLINVEKFDYRCEAITNYDDSEIFEVAISLTVNCSVYDIE